MSVTISQSPENLKVSVNFDLSLLNELINESTKCLL